MLPGTQEVAATGQVLSLLRAMVVATPCQRAGCDHRLRCHQWAQQEPVALAGVIALASDAIAALCLRAGGDPDYAAANGRRKCQQHLRVPDALTD